MPRFSSIILAVILIALPVSVSAEEVNAGQVEAAALSISQLTGVAINPLLVCAAIGVYKNIRASSAEERDMLPWYFEPWFLAVCAILAGLAFLISIPSITLNLPPQISGLVELLNKKIGLILVTPAVLNMVAPVTALLASNVHSALNVNRAYMYASFIPLEWFAGVSEAVWFTLIRAMIFFIFVAVWMLNYTFDALIFLCPFGWVDAFLKMARGVLYGVLIALSVAYPPLAFFITLPVIIISVMLFGWSIRRVVMAFVFLRDFLTTKKETAIGDTGIVVFSEPASKMPAKRKGRLREKEGKWLFTYKKFFLIDTTVTINKAEPVLKKGFIYSEIHSIVDNKKATICSLPPRYQRAGEQVQRYLSIEKIVESKLERGLKATIHWVKSLSTKSK